MITSTFVETNMHEGSVGEEETPNRNGRLIINADDWGRDSENTDRALDCIRCGTVSSVSAMVFMKDSERAAAIALDHGIDAGLHLNFTSFFSAPEIPSQLASHQDRLSKYLRRNRLAQVVFHPGLARSFEYVVAAQIDDFTRLYGQEPVRLDGHHHMHLCTNVLLGGFLPTGTVVRRNFSFQSGEKSVVNRSYRRLVDSVLGRRHRLTDFFFSIQPIASLDRIRQIFDLSREHVVEVETHPQEQSEYAFLTSTQIPSLLRGNEIASHFDMGYRRATRV